MFTRQKVAALVAEFLGTGLLTLAFLSTLRSQLAISFFIAVTAGLALALTLVIFGRISNGYYNPAVTVGLWTARRLSTASAVLYVAAQLLGGWGAYKLFAYLSGANLPASHAHYSGRTLVAEAVGTGVIALAIAAVAIYQRYSQAVVASFTGLAYAVGIILSSSVVGLSFLNPAVALGAQAWTWSTYVLGPVIGAVVAINLYAILFTENGVKDWAAALNTGKSTAVKKSGSKKKK
jgi:aquaporin Z